MTVLNMTTTNIVRLAAILATSLLVSGCFVTTKHMPAGTGPINDDALVGKWQGLDSEDGKPENTFFLVTKPGRDAPLHMVMTEDKKVSEYELRTTIIGDQHVLVARATAPQKAVEESGGGSFIAYYEATPEFVTFHLLDAEKVRPLILSGRLQGNPGKEQYSFAELTGSPTEVAAFLASKDGLAARVEGPGKIRRIH